MEAIVQESNQAVQEIRQEMHESVQVLSTHVEKFHLDINKQNGVIVGIQKEVQATVNDLSAQCRELKELVMNLLPSQVSTRREAPAGQSQG